MYNQAPYEVMRQDFDMLLAEARRQERLHDVNRGEYHIAKAIHNYFSSVVMPSIRRNGWVLAAATDFASTHVQECFWCWRLAYQEAWRLQKQLHDLNKRIAAFLVEAYAVGALTAEATTRLQDPASSLLAVKGSDLIDLLEWQTLPNGLKTEAVDLRQQAKDHEPLHLLVGLRGIRDAYETTFPRLMYVVRRAVKVELSMSPTSGDGRILGPSGSLSWYGDHLPKEHPLYYLLVTLAGYYKRARNVGNHHEGFSWHPDTNEVWLDDGQLDKVPLYDFQKRYRYFVCYLCEYGVRGVLAAYMAHEQGVLSRKLLDEYQKNFPPDFGAGPESQYT